MDGMRTIKNDKGSMYIYSILIVFVLTVLGVSLMGVVVSNLKMGVMTSDKNRAFYIADGAMEEVFWELDGIVDKALEDAQVWVNGDYRSTSHWNDLIDRLYAVDSEGDRKYNMSEIKKIIKEDIEQELEREYFRILLGKTEDDVDINTATLPADNDKLGDEITAKIKNTENMDIENGFSDSKNREVEDIHLESAYSGGEEPNISVKIVADASYNKLNKKVELDLEILAPNAYQEIEDEDYEVPVKLLALNDIYLRALTAQGDIVTSGGEVEINGDIYAYGTFPDVKRPKNSQMGGIVSGYDIETYDFIDSNKYLDESQKGDLKSEIDGSGSLVVNGYAATKSNLQVRGKDSTITILKSKDDNESHTEYSGNAYCNSFIVHSTAKNSTMTVEKNIVMYDDMEINVSEGKIYAGDGSSDGEIWGLIDGDPAGKGTAALADDELYGDRSSSIVINNDKGSLVDANRVYLAGTGYMEVFKKDALDGKKQYYQTGESVSLSKYSYAYMSRYSGDNVSQMTKYSDGSLEYDLVEGSNNDLNFKIGHFTGYASKNPAEFTELDIGNIRITGIKDGALGNQDNYVLGAVTANGAILDPNIKPEGGKGNFMSLADFEKNRVEKIKEIDYVTSLLGKRDYKENENENLLFQEFYNNSESIEDIVDTGNPDNIVIINTDNSKDVYINAGDSIGRESKDYDINGSSIKGIIFTTGNVFISGNTDFTGTIIARGNIVFYGGKSKRITYDKDMVSKMIAGNDSLYKFFYGDEGRKFEVAGGMTNDMTLKVDTNGDLGKDDIIFIEGSGKISLAAGKSGLMRMKKWRELD